MSNMKEFVTQRIHHLTEDSFTVDGDTQERITIVASPVRKGEVNSLRKQGQGLRIFVGAGNLRELLVVWAGDGNSNIGAIHETIAEQFGTSMYDGHVPLEEDRNGNLRVTTTAQGLFDDPREIEDVLDRNREFRAIFGTVRIDMTAITEDKLELEPIEVGDEIMAGKFKNSPRTVKGFKKDKHGQPVLKTNKGDTQLFKPRITKLTK